MPDPKYQPTSCGFAAQAVAEDLDRIADSLRHTLIAIDYPKVREAVEQIDRQVAALREIAGRLTTDH